MALCLRRVDETGQQQAKWEDLAAMLAKDGAGAVDERLRTVYGLTPGAATAVTKMLSESGMSALQLML